MDLLKQYSKYYKNDDDNENTTTQMKINCEINRVENESLDSTYRALRILNETEKIGIKTAAVRF